MVIIGYVLLGIYFLALLYITFFCLMQFHLLYHYQKVKKDQLPISTPAVKDQDWPMVTIQLPMYNEKYVVERLIDCIVQIDYPKDRLEIQILDDSNDETLELSRKKVEQYSAQGYMIELVTRPDRVGYKAGALKYGMQSVKGEFIAIFDADFLPRRDFLRRTIPHFLHHPKVGVVQSRWEHINEDYSIITRLQAFQLNVHFTVEQVGRKAGNYMLQFNGTAGVWRKETIIDAGGWEADTLTEDLDLSYRSQIRGWEIVYLENLGSPAELPAEMNGLKSQQFRWMKGGAETAVKILPTIWKSNLTFAQKFHASIHLLSSGIFLVIFLTGVFSVPLVFLMGVLGFDGAIFGMFLMGFLSLIAVYFVGNFSLRPEGQSKLKAIGKFAILFPLFLALSMGLSLHNSIAVLQGYLGKKSAFIRTPKFDIKSLADNFTKANYLSAKLPTTTYMEGVMALYFIFAIVMAVVQREWTFLLFHGMLAIGFTTIFYFSVKHFRLR